jgi:Leucine-rich repeat (LRR) protein
MNTYAITQYNAEQDAVRFIVEWEKLGDASLPLNFCDFTVKYNINMYINIYYIPDTVHTLIYGRYIRFITELPPSLRILRCIDCVYVPDLPEGLETLECTHSSERIVLPRLPTTLRSLNCSYSYVNVLPPLPPNLEYLNYEYTSIHTFVKELPKSLKVLICGGNGFRRIGPLPPALEYLDCLRYDGPFPEFPPTLKTIKLPKYTKIYIQQRTEEYIRNNNSACLDFTPLCEEMIDDMKAIDEYTAYICEFEIIIPYLPEGIETLICSKHTHILPPLPSTLKYVEGHRLLRLPHLPAGLEVLYCSGSPLKHLPKLSSSLRILVCQNTHLEGLPVLPNGLEVLDCSYNSSLYTLPKLPRSLRVLKCAHCDLYYLPHVSSGLEILECYGNISDEDEQELHTGPLPLSLKYFRSTSIPLAFTAI